MSVNSIYLSLMHSKLTKKNIELPPKPFQLFLSGGAGVGKSFQLDQPSVFVTTYKGKAATCVKCITFCISSPF